MNSSSLPSMLATPRRIAIALLCCAGATVCHAADKPKLPDGVTPEEMAAYFKVKAALEKKEPKTVAQLEQSVGPPENGTFSLPAVRAFEAQGPETKVGWQPFSLKIRENFDDLLAAEDPSQTGKAKPSDIKGASLAFSRNLRTDEDTWQGKGSLIFPFINVVTDTPTAELQLMTYGFTPSISYEGLDTQGDPTKAPTKEVDSLVYRLGGFLNLGHAVPFSSAEGLDGRMQHRIRGNFVYGTDIDHDVGIPGYELEYEPRLDLGRYVGIGHQKALICDEGYDPKIADTFDPSIDTILTYELRTAVRLIGGSVEDNDNIPFFEQGSFLRVGPLVELNFNPFFLERLSFSTRYQYFFILDGTDNAPARFDTSLDWKVWEDKASGQKFTLKASYVHGPLDFRTKNEESFLLGMGLTY